MSDRRVPFACSISHAALLLLAFLAALCLTFGSGIAADYHPVTSITIEAPPEMLENSITGMAIDDAVKLLKKGFPGSAVSINERKAQVRIVLSGIAKRESPVPAGLKKKRPYDYLIYPDHEYHWRSSCNKGIVNLELSSSSYEGTAFGIYGLLQEKLGFRFYHPRRFIIPVRKHWPLPVNFDWQATPRFDKNGFHIHTLHPVELAEQLNNPAMAGSLADVREYIDWLARNQQNVFQFYLLRDIDRENWIRHASQIVAYAHKRGILIGVEFSLSCLQQKAFQVINLFNPFHRYRARVDDTLSWLFRAKWDFVTVDFSMGEYMPDLGATMPGLRDYLIKQITEKYKTKLFYATHIIQQKDCLRIPGLIDSGCEIGLPVTSKAGVLIHTVMCYSIEEHNAPVYGNLNQRYMLQRAAAENKVRETWYWPESAYWVSFDNSVPLLLLPYLDARWNDMNTMKSIGVDNHLTFSSGWEWGYWLIDWSVARWSWTHRENGMVKQSHPLSVLGDLFPDKRINAIWKKALTLQDLYLKKRGLMPLMAALDPSAELSAPFNHPFQPRPGFTYEWLMEKSSVEDAAKILHGPIASLEEYDKKMSRLTEELKVRSKQFFLDTRNMNPELEAIMDELTRSMQITALRARHRSLTLRALIAKREERLKGSGRDGSDFYLKKAAAVRHQALTLVALQEAVYRYPVELLARKRRSLTAYEFGYLYPVGNLYFWWREEEQINAGRFDAFYLSIWDFRRIVGIESLFR